MIRRNDISQNIDDAVDVLQFICSVRIYDPQFSDEIFFNFRFVSRKNLFLENLILNISSGKNVISQNSIRYKQ